MLVMVDLDSNSDLSKIREVSGGMLLGMILMEYVRSVRRSTVEKIV